MIELQETPSRAAYTFDPARDAGLPGVAEIYIEHRDDSQPTSVFLAETVEVDGAMLTAVGSYTFMHDGSLNAIERGRYSWPISSLGHIRWLYLDAAAA